MNKKQIKLISNLANFLIIKAKKECTEIGSCFSSSNPKYYQKGYIKGIKDLKRLLEEEK